MISDWPSGSRINGEPLDEDEPTGTHDLEPGEGAAEFDCS